jgi:TPR repeat protein
MIGEYCGDGQARDRGRHHVTHRPSTAAAWTRVAVAAIVLLLSLAAPVAAGPREDATAAQNRGDYATARRLLHPLANQGVAGAQNDLGVIYYYGQDVPQDYAEAAKWFWLAADQGLAIAQNSLGQMYAAGEGVPQDYVRAHMWFNLSAAQESHLLAAEHRDSIAKRMTPAQIAEAQKLAREWQSKRP